MTLAPTISSFEARFEQVLDSAKLDEDLSLPRVCSGGVIDGSEIFPALYASEDLAVDAWLETANLHAGNVRDKLEWVYKPEIVQFQMTMADRMGRHRIVSPRYTVKAQFKVENG